MQQQKFSRLGLSKSSEQIRDILASGNDAHLLEVLKDGHYVRKYPTNPIKTINRDRHEIEFIVTTDTVDRDQERVVPRAFEKDFHLYQQNPVVLWAHSHKEPVVAQMVSHKFSDKEFSVVDRFAFKENHQAAMLWNLYAADPPYMRAVSAGFLPIESSSEPEDKLPGQFGRTFKRAELIEHSLVPIGSNRFALQKHYMETKSTWDVALLKEFERVIEEMPDPLEITNKSPCGHAAFYTPSGEIFSPCPTCGKGLKLSRILDSEIGELINDNTTRNQIIADMASAANIAPSKVQQALSGSTNCPPLRQLEGFARALDIPVARLRRAAEADGCNYNGKKSSVLNNKETSVSVDGNAVLLSKLKTLTPVELVLAQLKKDLAIGNLDAPCSNEETRSIIKDCCENLWNFNLIDDEIKEKGSKVSADWIPGGWQALASAGGTTYDQSVWPKILWGASDSKIAPKTKFGGTMLEGSYEQIVRDVEHAIFGLNESNAYHWPRGTFAKSCVYYESESDKLYMANWAYEEDRVVIFSKIRVITLEIIEAQFAQPQLTTIDPELKDEVKPESTSSTSHMVTLSTADVELENLSSSLREAIGSMADSKFAIHSPEGDELLELARNIREEIIIQ